MNETLNRVRTQIDRISSECHLPLTVFAEEDVRDDGRDTIEIVALTSGDTVVPIGDFWLVPQLAARLESIGRGGYSMASVASVCQFLEDFPSEPPLTDYVETDDDD